MSEYILGQVTEANCQAISGVVGEYQSVLLLLECPEHSKSSNRESSDTVMT